VVDSDLAAAALVETWEQIVSAVPSGWTHSRDGVVAAVTGVASPQLNGVWVGAAQVDPAFVAGLLDRVAATGMPYCLQARPDVQRLGELVAARGMAAAGSVPLMVTDEPSASTTPSELAIRLLAPAEADRHARVAAAGFEAPAELFLQLMTRSVLELPSVRCYLGEVGDEAVTTGLGVTIGSYVAVFNIAT
jgi:hypothetical protein